jgi:hypothetical protein
VARHRIAAIVGITPNRQANVARRLLSFDGLKKRILRRQPFRSASPLRSESIAVHAAEEAIYLAPP